MIAHLDCRHRGDRVSVPKDDQTTITDDGLAGPLVLSLGILSELVR
jgi:hypothetical protein